MLIHKSIAVRFFVFTKRGQTILSQPTKILNSYTFTALFGSVGHGLDEIYLMCDCVSYCEAFCLSQPILPLEFAESLRIPKSRKDSAKAESGVTVLNQIQFRSNQFTFELGDLERRLWVGSIPSSEHDQNDLQPVELSGLEDQLSSRGS